MITAVGRFLPSFAKRAFWRFFGRGIVGKKVTQLYYGGKDYLDGYIAHTNQRVARNPKDAVSFHAGMWEEMGSLQFDFLKKMGMLPEHRMLDLGCGTLRGGRHFIRYLDASNYTGIDISPACLDAAKKLLEEEQLEIKHPKLILNTSKNMKFSEFEGERFDFILAQSVFMHLTELIIRECFENIGKCMHEGSAFYFSYTPTKSKRRRGLESFAYPWTFFEELATDCGFKAGEISDHYPHPRGQKMGRITRA